LFDDILGPLKLSSWTMALTQLQNTGKIRPVLLLSGAGGEAAVQVDPTAEPEAAKARKIDLMATALAVSTAGYVFESVLRQPKGAAMRVAGFLLRSHHRSFFRVARIGRRSSGEMVMCELRIGIAGPEGLRLPHDLDLAFRLDPPGPEDRERAWHLLKEMGVECGRVDRALN